MNANFNQFVEPLRNVTYRAKNYRYGDTYNEAIEILALIVDIQARAESEYNKTSQAFEEGKYDAYTDAMLQLFSRLKAVIEMMEHAQSEIYRLVPMAASVLSRELMLIETWSHGEAVRGRRAQAEIDIYKRIEYACQDLAEIERDDISARFNMIEHLLETLEFIDRELEFECWTKENKDLYPKVLKELRYYIVKEALPFFIEASFIGTMDEQDFRDKCASIRRRLFNLSIDSGLSE